VSRNPAISTVLPVYNGESYLREAVDSILGQTFTDFELIIINDGSTDGSGAILREFSSRDPRIVLIERPNGGLVLALNEGIALARADLIARMDADDVAMPERFALQYARMSAAPQLGVLGSFIRLMDREGRIIRLADYPVTEAETAQFLEQGSPVAHPAVVMRRSAVLAAGGYRRAFAHCEDYDLWLRISEKGYGIANLPEPLLNYRMHGANVSTMHREAQEIGTMIARLSHRARLAGLPDPAAGMDTIDASLIDAYPAHLRRDMEAAHFVVRHGYLSLAGRPELEEAWREYRALGDQVKRQTILCDFLMRLLAGSVRNRAFGLALRALAEALRRHPGATAGLFWRKLKARVR